MGKGEGSLTEAQTGEAICTAGEGMRNKGPDPRKDVGTPHAATRGERNTVKRVRNTNTGDRKERGSTMM